MGLAEAGLGLPDARFNLLKTDMGLPEAGPCLPEASLGLPKAGLCQNRPLKVQSQILGGPRQAMLVFEARVSP